MTRNRAVLCMRDVRKSYRRHQVLRGVTLDLSPGQLVGIVAGERRGQEHAAADPGG
jgi:ABC-type sugar transport system ATPase subunit